MTIISVLNHVANIISLIIGSWFIITNFIVEAEILWRSCVLRITLWLQAICYTWTLALNTVACVIAFVRLTILGMQRMVEKIGTFYGSFANGLSRSVSAGEPEFIAQNATERQAADEDVTPNVRG